MAVKTTNREDMLRMRALTRLINDEDMNRRRRSNGRQKPPQHGTRGQYVRYRCRCEACVQANRAYHQSRREKFYGGELPNHMHGTTNAYVHYGCRCDECRKVATAARMDHARTHPRCAMPSPSSASTSALSRP